MSRNLMPKSGAMAPYVVMNRDSAVAGVFSVDGEAGSVVLTSKYLQISTYNQDKAIIDQSISDLNTAVSANTSAISDLNTAVSANTSAITINTSDIVDLKADKAAAGINSDITELRALSTAIAINQGGTGVSTQEAIWPAIRPEGATPLSGDPVQPYDATTKRWVENLVGIGTTGPTMNGVMNYGVGDFHLRDSRAYIQPYEVTSDGQLLNRADWPELWNYAQKLTPITDAAWLADPLKRGNYSTGDGSTTFRVPDRNGVQSGSITGLFGRGDAGLSSSNGNIQQNAAPDITGSFPALVPYNHAAKVTGAFAGTNSLGNPPNIYALQQGTTDYTDPNGFGYEFKASRLSSAYGRASTTEVRPNNFIGVWVIRASGGFVAANSSWSVINSDALRPPNNTIVSGGLVKSEYKIGTVVEGSATFYSSNKIGSLYAGKLDIYNNTKGITATFSFDDDGTFRAPNRVIVDSATLPGYILNTNGVTTGRIIQELDGKLNIINDKVGKALSIEANGTLNYPGPCYISSTGTFTGHIYSASATQNGSRWSSTGVVSKLLNRGGYGTPDGAYGIFATTEYVGSYYQAEIVINGFASDRTWAFRNDGNAYATSGAWINSSDERLKTNITRITDPLAKMRRVKGCTWDRVDSDAKGVGFIAQDIQAVIPEAVYTSEATKTLDDGTVLKDVLALDTAGAAAALHHEAILVLMDQIEQLKAEIAELKSK